MLPESARHGWPTALLSHCWRLFGPCTERGALPSRFAGNAHDTATSDLPTLLASWRRHLAARRMYRAELAVRTRGWELARDSLATAGSSSLSADEQAELADDVAHVAELVAPG